MKKINSIVNIMLDILFPKLCFGCKKEGTYLCYRCFHEIPLESEFLCPFCMQKTYFGKVCQQCKKGHALDGLWSVCNYKSPVVRQLVTSFKFHNIQKLETYFASLFEVYFYKIKNADLPLEDLDYIIPVPLDTIRFYERGFNQSEVFARIMSSQLYVPVKNQIVYKTRHTKSQAILKRDKRLHNLEGAFAVSTSAEVRGKSILLVDDVCTTGATLEACAKALKNSGAKSVWAIVFARSIQN